MTDAQGLVKAARGWNITLKATLQPLEDREPSVSFGQVLVGIRGHSRILLAVGLFHVDPSSRSRAMSLQEGSGNKTTCTDGPVQQRRGCE